MNNKNKSPLRLLITIVILIINLANTTGISFAGASGEGITISVDVKADCGKVDFIFTLGNSPSSYKYLMNFGDGDTASATVTDSPGITISHTYIDQGDFMWSININETILSETLTLEGPQVTLSSIPFPPLFVVGDPGLVEFSTTVIGGSPEVAFAWDLDGDGTFDGETGETATHPYTEPGKYYPKVMVTDKCGFTSTDSLPVVVADLENVCHPTAQKIADGVNTIFPDQSEDLYTCDDIYAIFDNESEENNLGFGRMWKAYNLAESMEELSWEDILDWHLNESGWGALLQLDRFADLLEEHDLPELMGLVMSDEYTLGDVRIAVRSTTRFEADFEDVLTRIAEGANPGELGQFYNLANELEADPAELDAYLADGLTLSELKQTAKLADRMEVNWTEIADARGAADSWGDISQAYRLANDEISAAELLILGVKEYKKDLREIVHETEKEKKEEKQTNQQEEKNKNTGNKLAEQFSAEFGDVMNLFNVKCEGDWGCVRKALREQAQTQSQTQSGDLSNHDLQTASQISSKYGVSEEEVTTYYLGPCSEDWACTRTHFRVLNMSTKETGKPEGTGKPDK